MDCFIIKPLSAKLKRDTDTFGTMDPFCVLIIGGQKEKTKTCIDGGKNPNWNDTLIFNASKGDYVQIEIWDQDSITSNDIIGQGSFSLNQIKKNPNQNYNEWIDLNYKGKNVGQILLSIQYKGAKQGKNKQDPAFYPQSQPYYPPQYAPPPQYPQNAYTPQQYPPQYPPQYAPPPQYQQTGYTPPPQYPPQQYPQQFPPQGQFPPQQGPYPQYFPPQYK